MGVINTALLVFRPPQTFWNVKGRILSMGWDYKTDVYERREFFNFGSVDFDPKLNRLDRFVCHAMSTHSLPAESVVYASVPLIKVLMHKQRFFFEVILRLFCI